MVQVPEWVTLFIEMREVKKLTFDQMAKEYGCGISAYTARTRYLGAKKRLALEERRAKLVEEAKKSFAPIPVVTPGIVYVDQKTYDTLKK